MKQRGTFEPSGMTILVQNAHGKAYPISIQRFDSTLSSYIFLLEKACGPGLDVLM
jgi:mannitol-specific phosphotransferase system IIBC component